MATQPSIKNKNDALLISDLKSLIEKEREVLTEILQYIKEVDERKLYLSRGFSSLFAFLTEELGYSEAAAYRRIQAMRLIRDVPEAEEKIETGKLSLSVASQLQGFIRKTDQKQQKEKGGSKLTQVDKLTLITQLEGTSARVCEQKLAQLDPVLALPKEKARPLTSNKTQIQFVASQELMTKIEKLKSLISHQNPEASFEKIFEKALDLALDKLDPERREALRRVRNKKSPNRQFKSLPTSEVKKSHRYISNSLRDKVWLRDKGKCQFLDKTTDNLCGSKHNVQIDHKYPFSLGGEHSLANLQLRCQGHNLYQSSEILGNRTQGK